MTHRGPFQPQTFCDKQNTEVEEYTFYVFNAILLQIVNDSPVPETKKKYYRNLKTLDMQCKQTSLTFLKNHQK